MTSSFQNRNTLYPWELRNLVRSLSYSSCSRCWLPSTSITSFGCITQKSTIYGPMACCFLKCIPSGLWALKYAHRRASASVGSLRSSPARCCMMGEDFFLGMMNILYSNAKTPPGLRPPSPNNNLIWRGGNHPSLLHPQQPVHLLLGWILVGFLVEPAELLVAELQRRRQWAESLDLHRAVDASAPLPILLVHQQPGEQPAQAEEQPDPRQYRSASHISTNILVLELAVIAQHHCQRDHRDWRGDEQAASHQLGGSIIGNAAFRAERKSVAYLIPHRPGFFRRAHGVRAHPRRRAARNADRRVVMCRRIRNVDLVEFTCLSHPYPSLEQKCNFNIRNMRWECKREPCPSRLSGTLPKWTKNVTFRVADVALSLREGARNTRGRVAPEKHPVCFATTSYRSMSVLLAMTDLNWYSKKRILCGLTGIWCTVLGCSELTGFWCNALKRKESWCVRAIHELPLPLCKVANHPDIHAFVSIDRDGEHTGLESEARKLSV